MAMESTGSGVIMGDDARFSCRMESNEIQISSGDYILVGKYGGYSTQKISKDTLSVELKMGANCNWIDVKSLHITKRNGWEGFTLPINFEDDSVLKIAFIGFANQKSILFLDDVRLYKPITNSAAPISLDPDEPVLIYNVNGTCLGNQKMINSLHPGVYIVCSGNDKRKIYIK